MYGGAPKLHSEDTLDLLSPQGLLAGIGQELGEERLGRMLMTVFTPFRLTHKYTLGAPSQKEMHFFYKRGEC